jgi:UDP-glucose 4-epimerase
MQKNAIVTGGAGFLGSHLVRELINRGYEVFVIDNLSNGKEENIDKRARFFPIDIRDKVVLGQTIEKIAGMGQIDGIFHLAALPRVQFSIDHPEDAHSVNVDGLVNVFELARKHKVRRIVYSASSSAYGNQVVMPLVETMKTDPMSPYAAQKLYGELMVKNYALHFGIETVALRYFNIVGPGADPNGPYAQAVIKFVSSLAQGKPLVIFGDGLQTRDSVNVADVVRANILALENPSVGKGEVINIGSGKSESIMNIARMVGGKITHGPARVEPRHTLADITLAKRLLGWEPEISLEETIRELKRLYGLA